MLVLPTDESPTIATFANESKESFEGWLVFAIFDISSCSFNKLYT